MVRLDKKARPYQNSTFKCKATNRLKVKRWAQIYHANTKYSNEKKM